MPITSCTWDWWRGLQGGVYNAVEGDFENGVTTMIPPLITLAT